MSDFVRISSLSSDERQKLDNFISNFNVTKIAEEKIVCTCPSCNKKDKLYISVVPTKNDSNKHMIYLHCFHNCHWDNIIDAVSVHSKQLYLSTSTRSSKKDSSDMRTHVYTLRDGSEAFKKTIYKYHKPWEYNGKRKFPGDKEVFWETYKDGSYSRGGSCRLLYHLDKLKGDTVYIPEGEKDVETLERIGFVATTNPGGAKENWNNRNYIKQLEGIKNAVILADNDEAGISHADDVARYLTSGGIVCKVISATDIYKDAENKWDISDITAKVGETEAKKLLDDAVSSAEIYKPSELPAELLNVPAVVVGDAPSYIICKNGKQLVHPQLLADYIASKEYFYFVQAPNQDSQRIFWYENGVYKRVSATTIKAKIRDIVASYQRELVKVSVIEDCYKLLSFNTENHYLPSDSLFNSDENIINFENGILNINTLELSEHSPDYLCTIQIPCKWELKETAKPTFDSFIKHLSKGESDAERTLIEAIGFCISNVSIEKYKASIFLIGEGDCGKSQFIKFIAKLVGSENYCAMPFESLEEKFQIANLYNKRFAADDDCKFCGRREVSKFKILTGGGELPAEEKNKQAFPFVYKGMYMLAANTLPLFGGDKGKHVYSRIIPIDCGAPVPVERRDKKLLDKLYSEREGIVVAAVRALKETIENNYRFTIGENSARKLNEYKTENDSTLKFIEECCESIDNVDLSKALNSAQMWSAFREWCRYSNEYTPKRNEFTKAIAEKYEILPKNAAQYRKSGNNRYYPFTLKNEYKELLHIYG